MEFLETTFQVIFRLGVVVSLLNNVTTLCRNLKKWLCHKDSSNGPQNL